MSIAALPVALAAIAESRALASSKKPPRTRLTTVKPDQGTAPEAR